MRIQRSDCIVHVHHAHTTIDRSEALYHDFAQLGDNAKANDRVSFER
jgi:hypothetical protein